VLLAGKFLFVPPDTFAVGIVQPQNAPEKTTRRKREREVFETQKTTRARHA